MKTIRWTCGINGFGIGVWRSILSYQTVWTVCLGPISIYLSRS